MSANSLIDPTTGKIASRFIAGGGGGGGVQNPLNANLECTNGPTAYSVQNANEVTAGTIRGNVLSSYSQAPIEAPIQVISNLEFTDPANRQVLFSGPGNAQITSQGSLELSSSTGNIINSAVGATSIRVGNVPKCDITSVGVKPSQILDSTNATGAPGQVLAKNLGGDLEWVAPGGGGGGVSNPLTADLACAGFNVTGATDFRGKTVQVQDAGAVGPVDAGKLLAYNPDPVYGYNDIALLSKDALRLTAQDTTLQTQSMIMRYFSGNAQTTFNCNDPNANIQVRAQDQTTGALAILQAGGGASVARTTLVAPGANTAVFECVVDAGGGNVRIDAIPSGTGKLLMTSADKGIEIIGSGSYPNVITKGLAITNLINPQITNTRTTGLSVETIQATVAGEAVGVNIEGVYSQNGTAYGLRLNRSTGTSEQVGQLMKLFNGAQALEVQPINSGGVQIYQNQGNFVYIDATAGTALNIVADDASSFTNGSYFTMCKQDATAYAISCSNSATINGSLIYNFTGPAYSFLFMFYINGVGWVAKTL
jgi:hypothetical protein